MLRRLRARLRAVHVSLWLILAVSTTLAFAWAIAMPPFQGPDETSHLAYTQRMVETRSIPWYITAPAPDGRPGLSSEIGLAEIESGEQALPGNLAYRANWNEVDEELWREHDAQLPESAKEDAGYSPAMRYPPLYYLYTAVPYVITSEASIFTRAFSMRLFGIPLLLGTIVLAWLTAGEVFGRRRWLQATVAGVVGLNPQLLHLTTVVNPDGLLALLGSAMIYLSVVLLRRGLTPARAGWMVAVSAGLAFTHSRGLSLALAGLLAMAVAGWRQTGPHDERARRRVRVGAVLAALGGLLATMVVAAGGPSPSGMREFGSYLWQFYLPRLGFMDPSIRPDWGARQAFVDRFFGTFGQLDAVFAPDLLDLVSLGVTIGLALLVVALVVQRRAVRRNADVALVLGFAGVFYLLVNHLIAYRALQGNPLDPVLTGRYLLPLIVLMGLAVATVVRALPRAAGPVAASAALSLAVLLQFAALGTVVVRFYA